MKLEKIVKLSIPIVLIVGIYYSLKVMGHYRTLKDKEESMKRQYGENWREMFV